jgi:pantoate kinase
MKQSRTVYVPSGVSSFFEICDRTPDGRPIDDQLQIGARGGGFIISKGTRTTASAIPSAKTDEIFINGDKVPEARTSLEVIWLIRKEYEIPPLRISHVVESPIGQGFGTSGAGALACSIAIGDLFDLKFTLSRAAEFAHVSELNSVTGLGTVISLASGTGAIGLVTEPGSYSVGRTDVILSDPDNFMLVCAAFGPIKKSSILSNKSSRTAINRFGRSTLEKILDDPTPERLLSQSRMFSEKTGLASQDLLTLSDKALKSGAIGATPNMIGNAIHCLVEKNRYNTFMRCFSGFVRKESMFESELIQSGPRISSNQHNV